MSLWQWHVGFVVVDSVGASPNDCQTVRVWHSFYALFALGFYFVLSRRQSRNNKKDKTRNKRRAYINIISIETELLNVCGRRQLPLARARLEFVASVSVTVLNPSRAQIPRKAQNASTSTHALPESNPCRAASAYAWALSILTACSNICPGLLTDGHTPTTRTTATAGPAATTGYGRTKAGRRRRSRRC